MKKIKSIVTEYPDICCICGRIAEAEHHLLFGNLRPLADKDGITVGICNEHHTGPGRTLDRIHDNPTAESLSKIAGQLAWEKHAVAEGLTEKDARKAFITRYGRSFL